MTCFFDGRWSGPHGIGRFSNEISKNLPVISLNLSGAPMSPLDPFNLAMHLPSVIKKNDWFLSPGYNAPIIELCPYVLTVHDLNHIDSTANSNALKRLYYRTVLRKLCNDAKGVFTVSEFSRNRLIDWFCLEPTRVFNVGNGISSIFTKQGPVLLQYGRFILSVGNRRGHKNESRLLEAFAMSDLDKDLKLIFTGEPSEDLLFQASKLNIVNRIEFVGIVSESLLASLYRSALYVVFPSLYEGFGFPILEAFACGTPVITSNITAMPEVAGDAAILINPYKVEDISEAMINLYHDSELRLKMIEKGYQRQMQFSWSSVANKIKRAIFEINSRNSETLSW